MTAAAIPDLPPLVRERAEDAAAVEALLFRAFGPGRFAKTAERLREGNRPLLELSFIAWSQDLAVGCVRLWPLVIGASPALLLGPFAVDAAWRGRGLGGALIGRACAEARRAGHRLVMLVGDEPYYAPFGFSAQPARAVTLPGPVDQRRVLVAALAAGAANHLSGAVKGRP